MSILSITTNGAKTAKPSSGTVTKWERPLPRQVKVNVDAAYCAYSKSGAVGVILRDYQGQFITAAGKYIPHLASVIVAEALAMKEGLSLVVQRGCNSIIAESDSLETIQACTSQETWWIEAAAIYLADIVDLGPLIGDVSFKHCPREANEVAHELARFCFSSRSSCNWLDEPPSFLLEKLINDVVES
jgi:ribonuclease HI